MKRTGVVRTCSFSTMKGDVPWRVTRALFRSLRSHNPRGTAPPSFEPITDLTKNVMEALSHHGLTLSGSTVSTRMCIVLTKDSSTWAGGSTGGEAEGGRDLGKP